PLQDPHCELPPRDKPLNHHLIIVTPGQGHRVVKVCGSLDHCKSDRGALLGWLHHNGPPEVAVHLLLRSRGHYPIRRGHAGESKQALGDVLVHRHGAPEPAASSVGNAHHLEKCLYRTVLTPPSVECKEQHLSATDDGKVPESGEKQSPL